MSILSKDTGLKMIKKLPTATQLRGGRAKIQVELCITEATVLCCFLTCQLPAKLEVMFLVLLTFQASKTDRPQVYTDLSTKATEDCPSMRAL